MTDVPYFSQWESPALVRQFLSGEMRSEDDPLWRNSGAGSADEYAEWSPHICGIACLKMLLAHRTDKTYPLLVLLREAVTSGVYRPASGDTGKRLHYWPFVAWLEERFHIQSKVIENTASLILDEPLRTGSMLMASVHPGIREDGFEPPTRGGHLVLVSGVNPDNGNWIFHNPSGCEPHTQAGVSMPRTRFDRYFANRGVLIAP